MHNTTAAQIKTDQRRAVKSVLRRFLATNDKASLDRRLVLHLEPLIKNMSPLALFWALPDEPDLWAHLRTQHIFAWPRMDDSGGLNFYSIKDSGRLESGRFGVREPVADPSMRVGIHELKGVCVPALAFDREGFRLGRGKGYYDQALKNFEGQKIGVGYSVQVCDSTLPREAHDVQMDFIVTEKERIEVKG